MNLTPNTENFIRNPGKAANGASLDWPVVEAYALSCLPAAPLNSDGIAQALSFSHSTTNAGYRDAEGRGRINAHRVRGDHKRFYESNKNHGSYFNFFWMTASGPSINPTVAAFKESLAGQYRNAPEDFYRVERMRKVVSYFKDTYSLYHEVRRLPDHPIQKPYKATAKIREEVG